MTTRASILSLLKAGMYAAQIARKLGLSQATVSYHIRRLNLPLDSYTACKIYDLKGLEEGLEEGLEAEPSVASKPPLGKSKPSIEAQAMPQEHYTRLHALGLKHQDITPFTPEQIEKKLVQAGIPYGRAEGTDFYFFELLGLPLRATPKSLTAWAKQATAPRGATVGLLDAKARLDAEAAVYAAASLLHIPINETYEVVQEHIAFVGDEGAELSVAQHHKIVVLDPTDRLARFTVDISTGIPETEFMHRRHALGDSKLYEEAVVDITQREGYRVIKAMQAEHTREISDIRNVVLDYGQKLTAHLPVLELAEELLKKSPSKRVHQAVLDLKQARL